MLVISNLKKSFFGLHRPAINGLSLRLNEGDFCVLLGANGSGKSTLLNMVAGEMRPDSGKITFFHKSILSQRHQIASVVQDVNVGTVPEMTLLENVALSYTKKGNDRGMLYRRYRENALSSLRMLGIGLEKLIDQPLRSLSGGQRQIVATMMAMMTHPKLLLLDEHTSALDPGMQKLLMTYTAESIARHKSVALMITHNMEDALQYGNRLVLMHRGKIAMDFNRKEKDSLSMQRLLDCFHQVENKDYGKGELL